MHGVQYGGDSSGIGSVGDSYSCVSCRSGGQEREVSHVASPCRGSWVGASRTDPNVVITKWAGHSELSVGSLRIGGAWIVPANDPPRSLKLDLRIRPLGRSVERTPESGDRMLKAQSSGTSTTI